MPVTSVAYSVRFSRRLRRRWRAEILEVFLPDCVQTRRVQNRFDEFGGDYKRDTGIPFRDRNSLIRHGGLGLSQTDWFNVSKKTFHHPGDLYHGRAEHHHAWIVVCGDVEKHRRSTIAAKRERFHEIAFNGRVGKLDLFIGHHGELTEANYRVAFLFPLKRGEHTREKHIGADADMQLLNIVCAGQHVFRHNLHIETVNVRQLDWDHGAVHRSVWVEVNVLTCTRVSQLQAVHAKPAS